MKRLLYLIITIMLLVSYHCALADESSLDKSSIEVFNNVTDATLVADTLIIAAQDSLFACHGKGEVAAISALGISGRLISNGDQLFVLDLAKGILHLTSDGAQIKTTPIESYELAHETFQDENWHLKVIKDIVLTHNYLYILVDSDHLMLMDLLAFEYRTGQWALMQGLDIFAIDQYDDDSIIAAAYDPIGMDVICELRIYNGLSSSPVAIAKLSDMRPQSISYQKDTNTLIIESNQVIYVYDFQTQPKIAAHDSLLCGGQAYIMGNNIYVFQTTDNELRALILDVDGMNPTTLVFAGARSVDTQSNPAFSKKYPDVLIKFRQEDSQADYAKELITKANAADIYCLPASSELYQSVVAKNYVASLSVNENIKCIVDKMYPQFAECLKNAQGKVVAIPYGEIYAPILYAYNTTAWETAKLNQPPMTVASFLEVCRIFSSRDELFENGWHFSRTTDVKELKKEILQLIIQTYISQALHSSETLSFNTPEFIALLSAYEDTIPALESICSQSIPFPQDGYIERQVRETSLLTAPGADLLIEEYQLTDDTNMEYLLVTIQEDAEPIIDVDMTVFVVNAASPQLDLAIEYLSFYIENMSERERLQYFPHEESPILVDYYQGDLAYLLNEKSNLESRLKVAGVEDQKELDEQIMLIKSDLNTLEQNKWAISKTYVDKFKDAAKYMRVYQNTGINFFMSGSVELVTLLNKYSDGVIPKEHFIDRYDQMVKMIFSEQSN